VSRIQQVIEVLEAERRDLHERVAWVETQLKEFHSRGGESTPAASRVPARAARRGTARRTSTRRATASTRQVDVKARIVEYLSQHPGSTASDVAKGLDLNRASASTRLSQMSKAGEISKVARGYAAK
jgi:CRP-like cAMP-binding protein